MLAPPLLAHDHRSRLLGWVDCDDLIARVGVLVRIADADRLEIGVLDHGSRALSPVGVGILGRWHFLKSWKRTLSPIPVFLKFFSRFGEREIYKYKCKKKELKNKKIIKKTVLLGRFPRT